MNTQLEDQRPAWRAQSQAGHYVVAAAIILAAVLLILFLPRGNSCCCCCQRAPVTASTTTLSQIDVNIPPGAVAPMPAVTRRVAIAPAIAPAIPVAPAGGPIASLPPDSIYVGPVAMTVAAPVLATFNPLPDLLTPMPAVLLPSVPSVHVDEAGSSLVWMALGVSGIFGALLLSRGRR